MTCFACYATKTTETENNRGVDLCEKCAAALAVFKKDYVPPSRHAFRHDILLMRAIRAEDLNVAYEKAVRAMEAELAREGISQESAQAFIDAIQAYTQARMQRVALRASKAKPQEKEAKELLEELDLTLFALIRAFANATGWRPVLHQAQNSPVAPGSYERIPDHWAVRKDQ